MIGIALDIAAVYLWVMLFHNAYRSDWNGKSRWQWWIFGNPIPPAVDWWKHTIGTIERCYVCDRWFRLRHPHLYWCEAGICPMCSGACQIEYAKHL